VKKRKKRAGWEHERKKGNMFGMFYFGVLVSKNCFHLLMKEFAHLQSQHKKLCLRMNRTRVD
jgi:hypothetical protein